MQELISVVMPCYQEPLEMAAEALDSILVQTYKNFEIIIVTEPGRLDLESMLEGYREKYGNIIVHVNNERLGLAKSLNLGIELARGKYIARMDADDLSLPWRLEWEMAYLLEQDLELVGTYYEIIYKMGGYRHIVEDPVRTNEIYNTLPRRSCIGHPTWLMKKAVWERLGGYENFQYAEDYHFLLKARKCEIRLGVMPKVCLKHREEETLFKYPPKAMVFAQYFGEHCEEIMDIIPASMQAFLCSVEGQKKVLEMEKYCMLRERFSEGNIGQKFMSGIQMFRLAYGRAVLKRKLSCLCGYSDK